MEPPETPPPSSSYRRSFQSQASSPSPKTGRLSASASVQSHYSSNFTQQRLRSPHVGKMADSAESSKEDEPTENTWTETLLPTLHDYRLTFSKHLTARSWWFLLLLGYCLISVLLFTGRIYTLVADGFHSDDGVSFLPGFNSGVHQNTVCSSMKAPIFRWMPSLSRGPLHLQGNFMFHPARAHRDHLACCYCLTRTDATQFCSSCDFWPRFHHHRTTPPKTHDSPSYGGWLSPLLRTPDCS